MIDLTTLLAEPARVAEVPLEAVPVLLTEAQAAHGDVAAVERALLARLRGESTLIPAPARRRSRRDVTVAEFAELAGVKPGTVYDWISDRRISVKKRGDSKQARVRIPVAELERLGRLRRPLRRGFDGQ